MLFRELYTINLTYGQTNSNWNLRKNLIVLR